MLCTTSVNFGPKLPGTEILYHRVTSPLALNALADSNCRKVKTGDVPQSEYKQSSTPWVVSVSGTAGSEKKGSHLNFVHFVRTRKFSFFCCFLAFLSVECYIHDQSWRETVHFLANLWWPRCLPLWLALNLGWLRRAWSHVHYVYYKCRLVRHCIRHR